jgi:hypothetical protein
VTVTLLDLRLGLVTLTDAGREVVCERVVPVLVRAAVRGRDEESEPWGPAPGKRRK